MVTDGLPASTGSSQNREDQNRIFTGRSFYVSRGVPCRQSFCDFIIANGGLSAQVDSKAEFIIVNPYKKSTYDTLVYSFEFLEDCRKDRQLKPIEEYVVGGGGEGGVSVIARTAPRRHQGGRVGFTERDDQILLNWINRPNIALAGNKVYQELELRYPHHPWRAWRSRWLDQLIKLMPNGPKPSQVIKFDDNDGQQQFTSTDDKILIDVSEDVSPRLSEVAPAIVVADQLQNNSGLTPPPKREAPRNALKRRASDPVVGFSTMGQSQSTSTSKRPVSRHSIVSQGPLFTSVIYRTPPSKQLETPAPHSTKLVKPPPSPKGHPAGDVMSSPQVKTDEEVSPVEQHVRVQKWRADVSKHATGESANDEDHAVQVQIQNEISEKIPPMPRYSKYTPSLVLDEIVSNKRKREAHNGGLVTPKRVRAAVQAKTMTPLTLDSPIVQLSSTPISLLTKLPGNFSQRSPTLLDPIIDGTKLVAPKEPYYTMSTQAIYDSITSDEEELLVNEEIVGLEDGSEEEDPEGVVSSFKDDDVFDTRMRRKGLQKVTGKLDFDKVPESFDVDGVKDHGSEDEDDEVVSREVAETAIYLVEKAAQWGVTQKDVIDAIERTSGEKMLVDVVLKRKAGNKGLPTNIPGVWTPEDDEGLLGNDARVIAFLEKKHGDRVLDRMDWLQKWREA